MFFVLCQKISQPVCCISLIHEIGEKAGNQYYASFNGKEYLLQDDHAAYFFEKWQLSAQDFVKEVLQDVVFWGEDLSK
jgi:tagaturonate reductase